VETDEDTPLAIVLEAADVDSAVLTLEIVEGPAHGTLEFVQGAYVYTPEANYFGPDSFTYQASDGELESGLATVTITVHAVNDAPVALAASATTDEDAPLEGTLAAQDVDGDDLVFALATGSSHGTVVVNPDGSYTYTPDADYFGGDSFTFVANDGVVDSPAATVSITV
ncbi:MAG: Ig-like domain-containing protein, partial [Burkholderiales bacterium]